MASAAGRRAVSSASNSASLDSGSSSSSSSASSSSGAAARAAQPAGKEPMSAPDSAGAAPPTLGVGHRVEGTSHELVYIMILGIRTAVTRAAKYQSREVDEAACKVIERFRFLHDGTDQTPAHPHADFKFTDYAPEVFKAIRGLSFDEAHYLSSLTSEYVLTELSSPGKSGAYLYFSNDLRFVIKTITLTEAKLLLSILFQYYTHVRTQIDSLLSRFFGLHMVKPHRGKETFFVIMQNVFPAARDVHRKYDLKGSTLGRTVGASKQDAESSTLKDLDFMQRKARIVLGPTKRARFLDQVRRDAEFLQSISVMDYSLLVGVHDLTIGNSQKVREETLSVVRPVAPVLASRDEIINANLKKKFRRQAKRALVTRAVSISPLRSSFLLKREIRAAVGSGTSMFARDLGGCASTGLEDEPLSEIYYMGIIDFLQRYNAKKKIENRYKTLRFDAASISAVPPEFYAQRFVDFIERHTGVPENCFVACTDVAFPPELALDEAGDRLLWRAASGAVIASIPFPSYETAASLDRRYNHGMASSSAAFATVTETATDGEAAATRGELSSASAS